MHVCSGNICPIEANAWSSFSLQASVSPQVWCFFFFFHLLCSLDSWGVQEKSVVCSLSGPCCKGGSNNLPRTLHHRGKIWSLWLHFASIVFHSLSVYKSSIIETWSYLAIWLLHLLRNYLSACQGLWTPASCISHWKSARCYLTFSLCSKFLF